MSAFRTTRTDEDAAVGLYAVGARDAVDFMDLCEDAGLATLETLNRMLTTPNASLSSKEQELNARLATLLSPILQRKRRGH